MNIWALIVAAGQGERLREQGGGLPKQFLPLHGRPLFWSGACVFARVAMLRGIVFVLPRSWPELHKHPAFFPDEFSRLSAADPPDSNPAAAYEKLLQWLEGRAKLGLPWQVALGGERRQDSVAAGLAALPRDCDAVLVHDGARPFVSASLIARVADALRQGADAVIPGVPVTDTIKEVDGEGGVVRTLERPMLRAVQTPQGFSLPVLREAHARAAEEGWEVTDDAALLERCGHVVRVVPGEERNRKITTPDDLELLRPGSVPSGRNAVHATRETGMIPCSAFGYDVHRYGGNRPLILGGVPVACDILVAAHSDGDTLLHALMDAMLGCIAGGDIGMLFPDSDPALENISSGILLSEVLERCSRAGLVICHVDITVIAQVPRIAPHRQAIAANLAKMLQLPVEAVNVKATTEEGLGFTGEKRGIKVMALVSGFRPAGNIMP